MNIFVPVHLRDSVRPGRVAGIMAFGFTERQAHAFCRALRTCGCRRHSAEL